MTIKDKLLNNRKKVLATAFLAPFTISTMLMDNVHFEYAELKNYKGNQFIFGFKPLTTIGGENNQGSIYSLGFPANGEVRTAKRSKIEGDVNCFGFAFGETSFGDYSEINGSLRTMGIVGLTNIGYGSKITGNMSTFGFVVQDPTGAGYLLKSQTDLENHTF